MASRSLLELGVFRHIVEKGQITSQELAGVTKADKIVTTSQDKTSGRILPQTQSFSTRRMRSSKVIGEAGHFGLTGFQYNRNCLMMLPGP